MPYGWIDPEVFQEHAGVTVYHIYKDDLFSSGLRSFWFTTNVLGSDDDKHGYNGAFDVRSLPGVDPAALGDEAAMRAAIIAAIDAGQLPMPQREEGDSG